MEQKINHLYQNGTVQLIKGSSTSAPNDDFEVSLYTLSAELYGVRKLTEGGGFITVVEYFKSLNDVTVWVQANIKSDTQTFEHFIDLGILLAVI